jgi:hypothetical protein
MEMITITVFVFNPSAARRRLPIWEYKVMRTRSGVLQLAEKNGIPVVGVYETMPTPGFDYQSWMLAEVNALKKAVTSKISTQKL